MAVSNGGILQQRAMSDSSLVHKGEQIGLSSKITKLEEQWVEKVTEWSTQYGEGNGNWGACNIEGPPRVYPELGDRNTAWAASTCAGKVGHLHCIRPFDITFQEFVVCRFATPRIPKRLEIYETSAPGALVKISGRGASGWIELWSGHADKTQMSVLSSSHDVWLMSCARSKSRIFVPPLGYTEVSMSEFRFETDATGWFVGVLNDEPHLQ
jgi:hypothetical protein